MRTPLRVAVGMAAVLCCGHAAAAKPRLACQRAYRSALALEQAGRLREAQKKLRQCARPACGRVLESQCTLRHGRSLAEMPSVVPVVKDDAGDPIIDVQV